VPSDCFCLVLIRCKKTVLKTYLLTYPTCLSVCLWQVWCTPSRARYIAALVSLLAAAVTSPEFFDSYVTLQPPVSPNTTSPGEPRRVMTSLGKSPVYAVGYKYINQTLFTFLPLTLLVVFNAFLVSAVRTAARRRHIMASGDCQATGPDDGTQRHLQGQQRITVRPQSVFTARCTLVQSAVLRSHVVCLSVRLSVRPSVTLVNCDHIGWNSSKKFHH